MISDQYGGIKSLLYIIPLLSWWLHWSRWQSSSVVFSRSFCYREIVCHHYRRIPYLLHSPHPLPHSQPSAPQRTCWKLRCQWQPGGWKKGQFFKWDWFVTNLIVPLQYPGVSNHRCLNTVCPRWALPINFVSLKLILVVGTYPEYQPH